MHPANDTDTITLTRENLHALSSTKDGFKASQLDALGVSWPPQKGWLSNLIGKSIPRKTYELAMSLRHVTAKQFRRQRDQLDMQFEQQIALDDERDRRLGIDH